MADNDLDDAATAAEWGATDSGGDDADAMAAEWAAMLDSTPDVSEDKGQVSDRVLSQNEIDNLLGFELNDNVFGDQSGIRAIINSTMVSYERLPMLELVFDRLVRLLTTSMRNFTSDNVEVSFDGIKSIRFGDYVNSIPLPAVLGVFKAEEWDNFGLMMVESNLIYCMVDVLLGGRRSAGSVPIDGRPYTTIEMNLTRRMQEVILEDLVAAFAPITPVNFVIDRLETNPRFATITRPANACFLVRLRIDMEDRGGVVEIIVPYATIEPIRGRLMQMFMGEKLGRDSVWEGHFATQMWAAESEIDVVLHEGYFPLKRLMALEVGETLILDMAPNDPVHIKCGDVVLSEAQMGRSSERVAVRVTKPLFKPRMTLKAFEDAARQQEEAQ